MKEDLNLLKQLRDITGAGILDCKKYLNKTDGDLDEAVKLMRSEEGVKADKKSVRTAAEGLVYLLIENNQSLLIEVNSETDFVARSDDFKKFVNDIASKIILSSIANYDDFNSDKTTDLYNDIETMRKNIITKLGENILIRRYIMKKQTDNNYVGGYVHNGKIGAVVILENKDESLCKDIAMQIVASHPLAIDHDSVDKKILATEKDIYKSELDKINKKDDIKRNILDGKVKKFLDSNTLLNQPFIKDDTTTLKKIIKNNKIIGFVRYELGEGIDKEKDDFAQEVYNQIK
ncbi:MAG: translation elongation factor Ts [Pseudomonadota bacterium]|nr:translation elongation factor Ts [Pseudomonadota bacterium]MED5429820.1 translation elongation factor Ts [Pseudomonadota bacterium]